MLNSSEYPAEECWALSQLCCAEVSVHRFQGSAQSSRFCGKIQIQACQWGNRPLLLHPAGTQLFWESTYSCPIFPHHPGGRRTQCGGKHWKVVSECWSPGEAPSAVSRTQLPRVGCCPPAGENPVGSCAVKQWRAWLRACNGRGLPPPS